MDFMRLCFYLIEAHFPTYPLQARNTISDFGVLMKSRQTGSFWERNVCPAPHVEPKTIKLAVFHVTIKKADIDRAGKSLVDGGTFGRAARRSSPMPRNNASVDKLGVPSGVDIAIGPVITQIY
jgi:hypothetical protein